MTTRVPPPPQPTPRPSHSQETLRPQPKRRLAAPLDSEFLGRTYVTTLWLGAICTLCAWGWTQSLKLSGSFAGGLLVGALLLKSQELFVRRILVPRSNASIMNFVARLPLAVLLPLKYLAIGLALGFVIDRGWLQPAAFAVGFIAQQVVVFSKVIGRFIANSLAESKVQRNTTEK
jgi:hypothetical protein